MPDGVKVDTRTQRGRSAAAREAKTTVVELLAFSCGGELYAVDLRAVHEIVIPPPITLVPRAPEAVLGVCSVRGQLATVVDLRRVLKLRELSPQRRGRVLLAKKGEAELVGLRVDEVRHVVRLTAAQIELSSQTLGGDLSEGVRGIGRPHSGEMLVLLDLPALLEKGCG